MRQIRTSGCATRKCKCVQWEIDHRGKSQKPRSLDSGRREIEFPKPIDKTIFRMVSKSSGRNESERRCGLESEKPQGLSLQPEAKAAWIDAD